MHLFVNLIYKVKRFILSNAYAAPALVFWRPYANWNLAAPVGDHEAISAKIIQHGWGKPTYRQQSASTACFKRSDRRPRGKC